MALFPSRLPLPKQWGVTQLTIHYAGEAIPPDDPFAAVMMLQLRTDAGPDAKAAKVAAHDRVMLERTLPGVELFGQGDLNISGVRVPHLELRFPDDSGRPLQQLMLFFMIDGHLYTLTGTHRRKRFGGVRPQILSFAARLLSNKG